MTNYNNHYGALIRDGSGFRMAKTCGSYNDAIDYVRKGDGSMPVGFIGVLQFYEAKDGSYLTNPRFIEKGSLQRGLSIDGASDG